MLGWFYLPAVVLGVTLSHFHQSSLGTLMTIVPLKVDPLWWSEMLPVTFLIAIVIGTLVLWLPMMSHGKVGTLEAFFTATSAVCVTGLVVVDTASDFTDAGRLAIAIMIQFGGLGIMTLSVFALVLVGRRVSMDQERHLKEEFTAVSSWRLGRSTV